MRPDDPRVLAIASAIAGLVDALAVERTGGSADELVPFPFGFERRSARALIRTGRLATSKIGRRTFARQSALVALVGDTPVPASRVASVKPDPTAAARLAYSGRHLDAVGGTSRR